MQFREYGGDREVEALIALMAKLPGLGPRSARRAVIKMIEKRKYKPPNHCVDDLQSIKL